MKIFNCFLLFFCLQFNSLLAQQTDTTNIVWRKLDAEPEFPGGNRGLNAFWNQNFRPKKFNAKGEGKVEFTINPNGLISNITIVKPLSPEADEAAKIAVAKMPRWKPAVYNGQNIATQYALSYWQEKINVWTGQSESITLPEPEMVNPNGWAFGLWLGAVNRTGDFAEYFKPTRFTMGLHIGYVIKRFQMGMEYDIVAYSKFSKTLFFNNQLFSPDPKLSFGGLNVYFPFTYSVIQTEKWRFSPYVAPTFNTFDIKVINGETFENMSSFSYTLGFNCDYTVNKGATNNYRTNKKTVFTSCIRGRFYVNPINVVKPNSAPLKGTAIGFSVGIHGFMNKEK